jgi:hypothetical protein
MRANFGFLGEAVLARLSSGILSTFDNNYNGEARFSLNETYTHDFLASTYVLVFSFLFCCSDYS